MAPDPIDGLLAELRRDATHTQHTASVLMECTLMEQELLGVVSNIHRDQLAIDQVHNAGRYREARARRDLYHHALTLHRAGELGA